MKYILFLFLCLFVNLSKAYNDVTPKTRTEAVSNQIKKTKTKQMRSYLRECIAETHVEPYVVKDFRIGNYTNRGKPIRQWALCMLHITGLMSKQGVFKYDKLRTRTNQDDLKVIDEILDLCLSKEAILPADIAWNYLICLSKSNYDKKYPVLGVQYYNYVTDPTFSPC